MTSRGNFHTVRYLGDRAGVQLRNWYSYSLGLPEISFYRSLASGFDPEARIDVLPAYNLIYVSIPKNASTTIKALLAMLNGKQAPALDILHTRRLTGLLSPSHTGLSKFYRIAKSPTSIRFAFVRNPYARLVSVWADKFQNKRLDGEDPFTDAYLKHRTETSMSRSDVWVDGLSFEAFAKFASATAQQRLNAHWNLQHDLLDFPGINLNFIGRVETFAADFAVIVGQLGPAGSRLKLPITTYHNASYHGPWQDYYTPELAKIVFRAYERDFDQFGYPALI